MTFDNYAALLTRNNFSLFYLNSVVVALGSVLVALPFAAMTGYAFARFRTGGRFARFLVLATQMLPPVALVLPTFAIFRAVGLTNSIPGLILAYSALNLPFLTWILMGFFEGVPIDLEWAAMTDGDHGLGRLLADRHPGVAAGHRGGRGARLHPVLERVPVRAGPHGPIDPDHPGGARLPAELERRADRQGFGRRRRWPFCRS